MDRTASPAADVVSASLVSGSEEFAVSGLASSGLYSDIAGLIGIAAVAAVLMMASCFIRQSVLEEPAPRVLRDALFAMAVAGIAAGLAGLLLGDHIANGLPSSEIALQVLLVVYTAATIGLMSLADRPAVRLSLGKAARARH